MASRHAVSSAVLEEFVQFKLKIAEIGVGSKFLPAYNNAIAMCGRWVSNK
jgi:hypothetical protein